MCGSALKLAVTQTDRQTDTQAERQTSSPASDSAIWASPGLSASRICPSPAAPLKRSSGSDPPLRRLRLESRGLCLHPLGAVGLRLRMNGETNGSLAHHLSRFLYPHPQTRTSTCVLTYLPPLRAPDGASQTAGKQCEYMKNAPLLTGCCMWRDAPFPRGGRCCRCRTPCCK